ncbi:helix-turn-helix domain-containing protein [Pseudonocardia sp. Cha107L01]|uniref:helix-turn-helix domain-containing protein n=1 Tax=Pseudonocardia sp. Cha107L01 TaxID=3457576 RepID=UPI00403EAB19
MLARPDFMRACAERDLGAMLRIAKQWGGAGFSASHLARRCELTVSRVQDYVNGRVQARSIEIFERVTDGLHIPGALLDLGRRPWEDIVVAATAQTSTTDGDSSVLRRDFLKLGAATAASTLATGIPGPTNGNRIGTTTVEALRANLARLRELDNHLGGTDTLPLYEPEVERIAALVRSGTFSATTRQDLQLVLAEYAQQTGWAAFDAGLQAKARQHFETSFEIAKDARSTELAGNALALRSYQLLSAGTIAPELTDRSLATITTATHPAVRSLLFQRGAWTYAVAGDAQRTARALAQASDALGADSPAGSAPDWAAWAHNQTELEIMAGRCWTELHRPMRAIPALEAAMSRYNDSHARDKALYLSSLADSYLDAGEIEHAAVTLGRSFDLAEHVASSRPGQRLNSVLLRLQPHALVTEVGELLARRPLNPVQVGS